MKINSVSIVDFRNYGSVKIDFEEGLNIVYGKNASGKTNLLEALFYFASLKSFRGCKEREMIRFSADRAEILIDFEDIRGSNTMKVVLSRGGKKELYCNNLKITKLSQFLGVFRAVIFTPDHLSLIKGMPENRRKFVDLAICQSFPRYVASLNEYNKILVQKNALLKSAFVEDQKSDLIDVYNEKMAQLCAVITLNRSKYIKKLRDEASVVHYEMSGNEKLDIEYIANVGDTEDNATLEDIREKYAVLLKSKKESEIQHFSVISGVHRDDFKVSINGKNAKYYASQGQQRTAVISLKLAEGILSKSLTGEYPVFLLDDVLSELDETRKKNIMEKIKEKQVILTGCDEDLSEVNTGKKLNINSFTRQIET